MLIVDSQIHIWQNATMSAHHRQIPTYSKEDALKEMADADILCDAPVTLVAGPEEYLFGEEKGLLAVIEGNDPLPRWLPPYVHGLFATTPQEGWSGGARVDESADRVGSNPTLVNNVETLAAVPHIINRGAEWYKALCLSNPKSTGTKLCSVCGHVQKPVNYEITLGFPLKDLIYDMCGGMPPHMS